MGNMCVKKEPNNELDADLPILEHMSNESTMSTMESTAGKLDTSQENNKKQTLFESCCLPKNNSSEYSKLPKLSLEAQAQYAQNNPTDSPVHIPGVKVDDEVLAKKHAEESFQKMLAKMCERLTPSMRKNRGNKSASASSLSSLSASGRQIKSRPSKSVSGSGSHKNSQASSPSGNTGNTASSSMHVAKIKSLIQSKPVSRSDRSRSGRKPESAIGKQDSKSSSDRLFSPNQKSTRSSDNGDKSNSGQRKGEE